MKQATKPGSGFAGAGSSRSAVPAAVFEDIVCGVDDSRGSLQAACQAVALSGAGGELRFVAVHHTIGFGLNEQSTLSERRATRALEEAKRLAAAHGLRASGSLVSDAKVGQALRAQAAGHGLLVIGSHGRSRLGGVILGATVTQIAHNCGQPLLIARRSADQGDFPTGVLLASDGSPGSWAAARVVARLAARRRAEVEVVFVPDGEDREARRSVLAQCQAIDEQTGTLPPIRAKPGAVPERICQVAQATQSSLIVIGRRGLGGIRALGSVSERVAHRASCSVLLVPAGVR